jgi:hypothetical protein
MAVSLFICLIVFLAHNFARVARPTSFVLSLAPHLLGKFMLVCFGIGHLFPTQQLVAGTNPLKMPGYCRC